jgi:hypothetical protein
MSKPSYVCVTCGEDFTRKTSAERHKANPNIHSNGNCNIVRFIEYVIGIAKGTYQEPAMLSPRLSSIRSKKKNKFFEGNKNVGEDSKVSTFPDLSKNSQLCGNELDKRISTLSSIKEEEKHEEGIDYCLRVASRTLVLKSLLEKLSGVGQGSPLISSQNGPQNNEDYNESAKSTFMDGAIANARKLVKLQGIMRELYKGGLPLAPYANALPANSGSDTDEFTLNMKDIFGFSAKECRNCVSFEIVPQHFDTADKDGFHRVPHKCREQVVLTHNLYQNMLYQNRKDMIVSSKKLIEFWTGRNVGMYAIDISNHTGESLVIKHPESYTKLIRVPTKLDTAIYLDVEREAHEDEEKENRHRFHKVVGKKQIIPLKRSDLVRFLVKTNGSSYGIFRIPQTVNNCNAEHVRCSPQNKMYFIYLARYENITSRIVYDDCYCNHDYDCDASPMEEERQNDELKENKLNIIGQPRTSNLLIAILLAMYLTRIFILHRPKRNKEDQEFVFTIKEKDSRIV